MPQLLGVLLTLYLVGIFIAVVAIPLLKYLGLLLVQSAGAVVLALAAAAIATPLTLAMGASKGRSALHYSITFEGGNVLVLTPTAEGEAWARARVRKVFAAWLAVTLLVAWRMLAGMGQLGPQPFVLDGTVPGGVHATMVALAMAGEAAAAFLPLTGWLASHGAAQVSAERRDIAGLDVLLAKEQLRLRALRALNLRIEESEMARLHQWVASNQQKVLDDKHALDNKIRERAEAMEASVRRALDSLERWASAQFRLEQLRVRPPRSGPLAAPRALEQLRVRHQNAAGLVAEERFDAFATELAAVEAALDGAGS
jgi:hypothetical protein